MGHGLKLVDFHPMHIYLNSADFFSYQALKKTIKHLTQATPEIVQAYCHKGEGAQTSFMQLVKHLDETESSLRLGDIYALWLDDA